MIFTFFIAAVFASQSFRAIANVDGVTGKYTSLNKITITHSGATSNAVTNKLGYGKVVSGNKAAFTVNSGNPKVDIKYTKDETDIFSAEEEFDYHEFLKSDGRELIVTNSTDDKIQSGIFAFGITAKSATADVVNSNKQVTITITETETFTELELRSIKDGEKIVNLTPSSGKITGTIGVDKLYSMVSPVSLGYVSAKKDTKFVSSDIITVDISATTVPERGISDDGMVQLTLIGSGKFQEFTEELQTKGGEVDAGTKVDAKAESGKGCTYYYAEIDGTTKIPKSIAKVELEKAPEVALIIVGQPNKVVPKLQIVGGKALAGTELKLDNVPGGKELSITLDSNGESDKYEWTKFKKVAGKKGSIYLKKDGIIDSVAWVIEDAKFTLEKKDKNAEKISIDFTMQSGMIKDMPTNLCIYAQDKDGKIIEDSVDFLPMEWELNGADKKSFDYEIAKFVLKDNYYAVMTASESKEKIKTEPLSAPILVHGTEPDPSGGAFSAVATIFAALVSLIVFAF